ncbi:Na+/H+ antiporter subunit D [Nakamurella deserti]|uniref:Na+/H+ antiporter subunit D n=1 Tax=Nakamurella deserti TaxID=2164074 RepID=UPI000DBE56B8|nr:Na+/H+ antiporter subunit D [Nakamurella deserti]
MTALLPVSVMLPMFGAALALLFGRQPQAQRLISVGALVAQLVVEIVMLLQVDANGTLVMHIGGWGAPIGITLVADRLAASMLVVSTLVTLAVLVYAIAAGQSDRDATETPVSIFFPAFLLLATGVSNAFLAGDLFNLFVSFEILLTASYVLLTLGGTKERLQAGGPYIVVSLLSSIIFLSAIALVYTVVGTINLADLAVKLGGVPDGIVLVLQSMLLVAFGVKAAIWPMSSWLPDSYPNAPAPVTAVFAGLLTKVGIYAILRVQTLLFPGDSLQPVLLSIAVVTMLVGILGALAQPGIKRLLSFTLVSHIGYLLYGVGLASAAGVSASVFYVAHHILVQTALFLAAGLIERVSGTTMLARLGGLAAVSPLLAVLFFLPAMNLAGVPPFSGFLGKVGLFEAGVENGSTPAIVGVVGGVLTSLLTLYTIVRVWGQAFWREAADAPDRVDAGGGGRSSRASGESGRRLAAARSLPAGMLGATAATVTVGLLLTVFAGPLFGLASRAGDDLMHPDRYITAVLSNTDVGVDPLAGGGTP